MTIKLIFGHQDVFFTKFYIKSNFTVRKICCSWLKRYLKEPFLMKNQIQIYFKKLIINLSINYQKSPKNPQSKSQIKELVFKEFLLFYLKKIWIIITNTNFKLTSNNNILNQYKQLLLKLRGAKDERVLMGCQRDSIKCA